MPATLWSDGFESGTALGADYTVVGPSPVKSATAAKNGGQGLLTTNATDGVLKILGTQGSEGSTGFWVNGRHLRAFGDSVFEVRRVSFVIAVALFLDGRIRIYDRFNTNVLTSAAGTFPPNTWKYLRVEWKLTDSAAPLAESFVKVYLGDTTNPPLIMDTGLVTNFESTSAEWDRAYLEPIGYADDWEILDGPPSPPVTTTCPDGYRVWPVADLINEGWTGPGWDLVNDPEGPDDGTFTSSPLAPQFGEARLLLRLQASRDPGTLGCYVLRYRLRKSAAGGSDLNVVVRLWQGHPSSGGILVASWTHLDVSETFTTFEQELSEVQAGRITDFTNLLVEFDPYQG